MVVYFALQYTRTDIVDKNIKLLFSVRSFFTSSSASYTYNKIKNSTTCLDFVCSLFWLCERIRETGIYSRVSKNIVVVVLF